MTSTKDSSLTPSGIIIIGSGPAGCAAAITCAQAGMNTILITNNKITTDASALESIHPGVSSLLEKINASDAVLTSSRGMYDGIQTGNKYVVLGADENGTWKGNHIDRAVFDAQLLNNAARQGVSIINNETVRELIIENNWVTGVKISSGEIIHSAYVIDASGHKRFAGKKLKFKEKFFSPPFVLWTGVSTGITDTNKFFTKESTTQFIPEKNGWTWLAPQTPDRCTWTRLAKKGMQDLQPPKELIAYPIAGKIKVANMRWRVFRPLCKEGLVLCGDAAGILDPAAGQGILNALWSGIKAGQTVVDCLQNPDEENLYLTKYDDWFLQQYLQKAEQLKNYYSEHAIDLS